MNSCVIIPSLSPNIEIHQLEDDKYMIHQTEFDKRILITKRLHDIIQFFEQQKQRDLQEALCQMGLTAIEVEQLYTNLAKYGIVAGNDDVSKKNPASYLTFKATLIPEKIVKIISSVLAPLFTYWFFIVSTLFFLGFTILLMANHLNYKNAYEHLNAISLLKLQGIFMAGLILHEFGHASACKNYGANPGSIGFGFYLFTPVLYADVSDAWKLNKYQRIIIDLGGFYLQIMYSTVLGMLYLLYGDPVFISAIALNLVSIVINLNPFFRYDGYWALSDGLGIYNMRPKALAKVNSLIAWAGRKTHTFSLKTALDIFLFVYGLLCYSFLFFFLFYIVIKNPQSVLYLPVNIVHFFSNVIHHKLELSMVKTEFRRLLVPLVFYIIIIKYIIRNRAGIKSFFTHQYKRYEV